MSSADSPSVPGPQLVPHGRLVCAGQPLVFHCNHYNHWLQHTLRLDPALGMDQVIEDAAVVCLRAQLRHEMEAQELAGVDAVFALASGLFAQQGFGRIDLSEVRADGGIARTPTSHYGQLLTPGRQSERMRHLPDRGFARAAAEVAFGTPFRVVSSRCQSMGADVGEIELVPDPGVAIDFEAPGVGAHSPDEPGPPAASNIDEQAVLEALGGLDLSGNEEGLIPRFGVVLTQHYANFYNRVSFEFVRRMDGTGMLEGAEELLVNAGFRCAFNTFGGIMTSGEWSAVVGPQIRGEDDWIHGMVACVNALGWGVWRVHELQADRLVVRIYDDYESAGWRAMYGQARRPVSYLHMGGVAGLMNLVRIGRIMEQPTLDETFYQACFETEDPYSAQCTRSFAMGDPYTEIVAERT